jgi:hypothetical protein
MSGQMRTVRHVLPFLEKYLLFPNEVDVFVAASSTNPDDPGLAYLANKSYVKAIVAVPFADEEWLKQDHPDLPYPNRPADTTPVNTLNMFRSEWLGNALRRAHAAAFHCDHTTVVRLRPDMALYAPLLLADHDPAALWVLHGMNNHGGINDIFAFGPPALMDPYFDTYFAIPALYRDGVLFNPELLLRRSLARAGLREARPGEPPTALRRLAVAWALVRDDLAALRPGFNPPVRGPFDF